MFGYLNIFSVPTYCLHSTREGGTPLFGLYGDVPLDRVWFFGLVVLNRVWYYEPGDFNPDCEESLSFLSLRPGACEKWKAHVIERRTSDVSYPDLHTVN